MPNCINKNIMYTLINLKLLLSLQNYNDNITIDIIYHCNKNNITKLLIQVISICIYDPLAGY